ncbi:MAG TPA: hypothetical protein VHR66_30920 [Gemmataceae bacterium]|nr:hypothetical protein [Gemmataceae bacterium]
MSASLVLHRGGHEVPRKELVRNVLPPATRTWRPSSHEAVLDTAEQTLTEAGYRIAKMRLGVSHEGQRFFGTLNLSTPLTPDGQVALAVGLRNSTDQSFPMGFGTGARVFACDNLTFRSELLVKRKHTVNSVARFSVDIAYAVGALASFKEAETHRIEHLQQEALSDAQAESFILRACIQRGIIAQRQLPLVFRAWHEPPFEDFRPRTAW